MDADGMARELTAAAIAVLTRAAFVMPKPARATALRGEVLQVRLDFTAPISGQLLLASTAEVSGRVVSQFTGTDTTDRASIADGLGEILNMIAGKVMAAWFGPTQVCTLGFATSQVVAAREYEASLQTASIAVRLATEEDDGIDVAARLTST